MTAGPREGPTPGSRSHQGPRSVFPGVSALPDVRPKSASTLYGRRQGISKRASGSGSRRARGGRWAGKDCIVRADVAESTVDAIRLARGACAAAAACARRGRVAAGCGAPGARPFTSPPRPRARARRRVPPPSCALAGLRRCSGERKGCWPDSSAARPTLRLAPAR